MAMERSEYPAMLATLQPGQAVDVLNDRVRQVGRLNTEIADWLQERRRLEESYSNGLRKLARRNIEGADLGTFAAPWTTLTNSAENLAESHSLLASKIEVDVERPLREFANSNREMTAMSNMQGNLSHIARDVDRARQKLERLQSKGDSGKIASATGEYENTQAQWDSQAPYVFENLQAADESRWNHLRDVLTQFQTHEIDQVEKHRVSAEQVLNILLSVETADEVKTFALHAAERGSATQASSTPAMPPPPSRSATVASSLGRTTSHASEEVDGSIAPLPEKKGKGAFGGLKRLGTVMGRRRESKQPQQLAAMSESPERKPKSSPFNSFSGRLGRSKETPTLAAPNEQQRPRSPLRLGSEIMEPQPERVSQDVRASSPPRGRLGNGVNGMAAATGAAGTAAIASKIPNGSHQGDLADLEPPRAVQPEPTPAPAIAEPERDNEGYSVPSRDVDPITQAQQDAADAGDVTAPQFNVNIRDAPVQDAQGEDAQAAIANLANRLQMQAPPQRLGTVRGRREQRNSYVPPPMHQEIPEAQAEAPVAVPVAATPLASPLTKTVSEDRGVPVSESSNRGTISPALPSSPAGFSPGAVAASTFSPFASAEPTSPSRQVARPAQLGADLAGDGQSIRSGRSLASTGSQLHRHPELSQNGLNSSIIETVSARFENGQLLSSSVTGEIALAYNPPDFSTPFGTDTIRLDNFASLEKIAPNPAFINPISDRDGEYTVNLSSIAKTQIAFKYQTTGGMQNAPIHVTLASKIEPTQISIIVSYSLSPSFRLMTGHDNVTLSNVVLALSLEGARATSCLSKPVGTFSREKNLIFWTLGDVALSTGAPAKKLLARFVTESEATGGAVEARWEVAGDGLGSGVGVSVKGENSGVVDASDPFADEDSNGWKEVRGVKKLASGHYVAK